MRVHPFGAVSSPSCSNYALHTTANVAGSNSEGRCRGKGPSEQLRYRNCQPNSRVRSIQIASGFLKLVPSKESGGSLHAFESHS